MTSTSTSRPVWTAEKLHLLAELVRSRQTVTMEPVTIPRIARTGDLALSFGQERLWFVNQLAPDNPFYNDCEAFRLRGPLDIEILRKSLERIVARHEILRTSFPSHDGAPVQKIHGHSDLAFEVDDISDLPGELQAARTTELADGDLMSVFDLERGPLLRFRLVRHSARDHVLLLTLHHIVFDGWSLGVFVQELVTFYEAEITGTPAQLPPLRIQYADFAAWQRRRVTGQLQQMQLDYWRQRLAPPRTRLELPTDYPRPGEPSYRGRLCPVEMSADLAAALHHLACRENVTLFVVLLAVYKMLLHSITGVEDIFVGTPVANRNHRDLEPLLGFILNTLVLRTSLSADLSFRELLVRVAETTTGACDHQDLPFEKLVADLKPQRRLHHNPLFQVWFTLLNAPPPLVSLQGLELSFAEVETRTARFDLALILWQQDQRLRGHFEYSCDLFDEATVKEYAENYLALLKRVVNRPESSLGELVEMVRRRAGERARAGRRERKQAQERRLKALSRGPRRAARTEGVK